MTLPYLSKPIKGGAAAAHAGRTEFFFAAMVVYAAANACIGATPAAYAADVMPSAVSGFGLGIYRCAGDIGAPLPAAARPCCAVPSRV